MSDRDSPFQGFARAGGSKQQLEMLAAALRQSPKLNAMASRAMAGGDFQRLSQFESETRLGQYSTRYREIAIESGLLKGPMNRENLDRLTNTFAHELSHAANRQEMFEFSIRVEHDAFGLAEQPGPRDGTDLVREYIDKGREQETLAELAGINALADRMRNEGRGDVTEAELAERLHAAGGHDLVDQSGSEFRFKPGITFDPVSQSVPATPENIETVAQLFFDVDRGDRGYREFYAAAAISALARGEAAYRYHNPWARVGQTRIDLAALGVDPDVLRKQEFDFGEPPVGPYHFVDSSHGGSRYVDVAHTGPRRSGAPSAAPEPGTRMHADHPPPRQEETAATARPGAAVAQPDVERFFRALEAGDEATAREAAMAFANSAAGRTLAEEVEGQVLAGYRRQARSHPLEHSLDQLAADARLQEAATAAREQQAPAMALDR
ncbi:hypothetical protein [Pseudoxanthomonas koreensis]|uniref:hypothetical protein n=1 Tax=Pseudoxanthomonas koreensis TaxID=266061 RepID=UPI0035A65AD5